MFNVLEVDTFLVDGSTDVVANDVPFPISTDDDDVLFATIVVVVAVIAVIAVIVDCKSCAAVVASDAVSIFVLLSVAFNRKYMIFNRNLFEINLSFL